MSMALSCLSGADLFHIGGHAKKNLKWTNKNALLFSAGIWNRDSAGSKIPLWVVIFFLTQGSGPIPLCSLTSSSLFPSLHLGPARFCFLFFVLVCRTYLILLFFCLYICRFTLLPGCSPLPFFLPNISVLCVCSLILTLAMSSLSSLIRLWLHVLSAILSVHFTPSLCLLKQETSWYRIKSPGHWLESLLTVWAKL